MFLVKRLNIDKEGTDVNGWDENVSTIEEALTLAKEWKVKTSHPALRGTKRKVEIYIQIK